jgi:broad specificity phosphatase PhoE
VDRAWEAVRALTTATSGDLAVVTHGLVCKSLAGRHLGLGAGVTVPERWENTSLTIVDGRTPWRVSLLNCIVHLEDPDLQPARGSAV